MREPRPFQTYVQVTPHYKATRGRCFAKIFRSNPQQVWQEIQAWSVSWKNSGYLISYCLGCLSVFVACCVDALVCSSAAVKLLNVPGSCCCPIGKQQPGTRGILTPQWNKPRRGWTHNDHHDTATTRWNVKYTNEFNAPSKAVALIQRKITVTEKIMFVNNHWTNDGISVKPIVRSVFSCWTNPKRWKK